MSLEIRTKLNDEYEAKFLEIAKASVGNKTHVKNQLIEFAIDKFHKKMFKPADINKRMEDDNA